MSVNAVSATNTQELDKTKKNAAENSSEQSKDCAIDTQRFTNCSLAEFKLMAQEGLEGDEKEFFERLKSRGVERIFKLFDEDGNGVLSRDEAIMVSSIGIDQTKASKRRNSSTLKNLLSSIGSSGVSNIDYSSLISMLSKTSSGSSTGAAASATGSSSGSAAVQFAMQFEGQSGAQMAGKMSPTGYHAGVWCADFVYFALKNANSVPPGYDSINHAYCPSIAAWARSNGRAFSDPSQAKPGDLLIMNSEGHIGIVTKVDSQGIHTIEGNTSGPNGYGSGGFVAQKVRDFGCVSTFVRI